MEVKISLEFCVLNSTRVLLLCIAFFFLTGCADKTVTVTIPPAKPDLISPADRAVNVPLNPVFQWSQIPETRMYELQVSQSGSFTYLLLDTLIDTTILKGGSLKYFVNYFWRVRSVSNNGKSEFTDYRTFLTTGSVPDEPRPLSPIGDSVAINYYASFVWDYCAGAQTYNLQIASDENFTNDITNISGLQNTTFLVLNLMPNTNYYWRVRAENSFGFSSFSKPIHIVTGNKPGMGQPCEGLPTVLYNGKTYNTVQIGTQCWLRENLDIGMMILDTVLQVNNDTIEKYCYKNIPENCIKYGGFYSWDEAMKYNANNEKQGICPAGWHIPTVYDFYRLIAYVGKDINLLTEKGLLAFSNDYSNLSGFSMLFGGTNCSSFLGADTYGFIWSSDAYSEWLSFALELRKNDLGYNAPAFSRSCELPVRCIKNQ